MSALTAVVGLLCALSFLPDIIVIAFITYALMGERKVRQ